MFITSSPNKTSRRAARLGAFAAVPLVLGMLAGCSAGEPESTPKANEMSFEDWQVKFATCMRGEGIDMPDPGADGAQAINLDGSDMEAMDAASKKCMGELGDPPAVEGGQMSEEEFLEEQMKMAQCFRDNGLDVDDPKKGQGFTFPEDAPEDVIEECAATSGGGSGAVTFNPAG